MDAAQLAREVKAAGLDIPVVVLAYDYREFKNFVARNPVSDIERDVPVAGQRPHARSRSSNTLKTSATRCHDTSAMGVPVILVVEDNIRYYSSFLPVDLHRTDHAVAARDSAKGSTSRTSSCGMRARPKILLASNYEEAAAASSCKYRDYLLGVRLRRGVPARRANSAPRRDLSWPT